MPVMSAFRVANFSPDMLGPGLSRHVFLIAIRESQAPLVHGGRPLHPMQVMLAGPGEMPPLAGLEAAVGPLPALPPPHRLMRNANPSAALMPREITGEILRDGGGRLYEKTGDAVRPIHHLFAGSRGEMIDLAPIRDVLDEAAAANASGHGRWSAADASSASSSAKPRDVYAGAEQDEVPSPPGERRGERSLAELARRLTPEPGLWRLIRYADFIDVI